MIDKNTTNEGKNAKKIKPDEEKAKDMFLR